MNSRYSAYIFDLYGTLIDIRTDEHDLAVFRKLKEDFGRYGAFYDEKELHDAYFGQDAFLRKKYAKKDHHIEIDIAEVYAYLLTSKQAECSDEIIAELAHLFRTYSTRHIRLYAHAKEVLETLRKLGSNVFLLSNAQHLYTMNELKRLELPAYFDDIFISSVSGYMKPDPVFMKELLDKHGLKAKDCLMIGNDPYSDIGVAINSGMDMYYIQSGRKQEENNEVPETAYRQKGMDLKKFLKTVTA